MTQLHIIDAYKEFVDFWPHVQAQSLDEQIEGWYTQYMAQWPKLRHKQIDCYAEEGEDWREIAREHVFPFLPDQLTMMQTAHDNLLEICADVHGRFQQKLPFDSDLIFIIYVGIGCGAGWATTFDGKPAILFGLENIAAEGWQDAGSLTRLIAHELGHIAHFHWRKQAGLSDGEDAWWQLYTEGFAQWCEHLIMEGPTWHMKTAVGDQWQTWCQENVGWLAAEFLRRVEVGEDIRPFFGSWYELQGYKQTGYFLGHEVIKAMSQQADLREIALLKDIPNPVQSILIELAG